MGQESTSTLEHSPRQFPPRVLKLLEDFHRGGVSPEDCRNCSSDCCSHPGFGILENVELIYEIYRQGRLKREDYEFPPDLSASEFLHKCFHIARIPTGKSFWTRELIVFRMKTLSRDNELIAIPTSGYYYDVRYELFNSNPWLNKGCIFLNKRVDEWSDEGTDEPEGSSRHCILHSAMSATHVTAKPIDCVFHTCRSPHKPHTPTFKESRRWYRALAVCYPHSFERFNQLVGDPDGKGWGG